MLEKSAVSFLLIDTEIKAICTECASDTINTDNILKKINKMFSESLFIYCESRKKEVKDLINSVSRQIYKKLREIIMDLARQIKRYEIAVASSAEKMCSDQSLQMRLTKLYDKNSALRKQFLQELGMV